MKEPGSGNTGFSGTQLFLAVLGGAAAGAAVALLAAPKSGRETRAQIADVLKNGKEKARHLPGAVKVASSAARNAFVDAMREEVSV